MHVRMKRQLISLTLLPLLGLGLLSCTESDEASSEPPAEPNENNASPDETPADVPDPEPVATEPAEPEPAPAPAAAEPEPEPTAESEDGEISLFDGKTLGKWKPVQFGGEGETIAIDGHLLIGMGAALSGVVWDGDPPATTNYEIEFEAMKITGDDFMVGLTVPVGEKHCTWVCGGWGGGVVGVSSIDGLDASENETATVEYFEPKQWYKFKMRVEPDYLSCWIDDKQVVDVNIKDREIGMRPGDIELCIPLGLATFQTRVEYRNIVWRPYKGE